MDIRLNIGELDGLQKQLQEFSERRLAATLATALTRTAVYVRGEAQRHAEAVFDRPKPYTLRQLRYMAATAANLAAEVGFDIGAVTDISGNVQRYQRLGAGETPASKYLTFEVSGGTRRQKRFEVALRRVGVLPDGWVTVPGERAKLDAYGNQAVGELRQIMSWFDAAELVAGSRQNMRDAGRSKRIKGTRRTAGWEYVLMPVGSQRQFTRSKDARGHWSDKGMHKMQPGIYRRTHLSMGTRMEPVVIFVRRATYQPRFDFDGVTRRAAQERLPQEVSRAVGEALGRLAGRA